METALPSTTLNCTQCGGELHPDEGQLFLTCPYCAAAVYVDKARVVFHWHLAPTLNPEQARGALFRWMSSNATVKDLDKKSSISESSFCYFPMWHIKSRQGAKETVTLEPAAAITITELRTLSLPAGDLRKYDSALDSQSVPPTVPLQTALTWANQQNPGGSILETALVHIPVYTYKYAFNGQTYTAIVEAGTGKVFANIFPAKAEAPYLLVGLLTAGVYLCLAAIPVFGAISGDETFMMTGGLICSGVGLVAFPFLFALAAWVAAKV